MVDDKSGKDEGLLVSVAESIGSTLGSLAAKASAAQKSIGSSTKAAIRNVSPAKRKTAKQKPAKRVLKSGAKRGAKSAGKRGSKKRSGKR